MKYCSKCLQPDTRPNIRFDEDDVCPPCQYMDKFKEIDWNERDKELQEVIKFGKENNVSGYDCIIGVSGGKDSLRQSLYVRDQLKLKPLLVHCSYPPEQLTEVGAENISNLIDLGFDTVSVSPGPLSWKELMKQGFFESAQWSKSTEMALFASLPKMAIAYHIPLIFLGENPATQDGELGSGSLNWDGTGMRNINTIKDGPDKLIEMSDKVTEDNTFWYRYPLEEEMESGKIKIVYLGYFIRNFTKPDNGNFSIMHGLEIRDDIPKNTGDIFPFECVDEDFVIMNQMIKYMKLGFGKVTEEVSEAIRLGVINRELGIELLQKYDGKCDEKYILKFCDYIGISTEEFWNVAESFRNRDIWIQNDSQEWELKVKP